MKRHWPILALTIALVLGGGASAQADPRTAHSASNRSMQFVGADGATRTLQLNWDQPTTELRALNSSAHLQPGDTLTLSPDAKRVIAQDSQDRVIFTISSPELRSSRYSSVEARFTIEGDMIALTTVDPVRQTRAACPQSWWGNFLAAGVGGGIVCGALGAATGGVAGVACGIGVHAAASAVDWDSACKPKKKK